MTASSKHTKAAPAKPRGRDAAIAAIVASARELYRERTPGEVTMQEIADRANVNRGLVHHYFGSKEDLFAAIFRITSDQAAAEVRTAEDVLAGLARSRRRDGYPQMLAWALISGMDAAKFVTRSPTMAELTRQAAEFRKAGAPRAPDSKPVDERIVISAAIALSMGWQIFEPFMVHAGGLDDVPLGELRSEVGRIIDLMVTSALQAGAASPESDPATG